MQEVMLYLQAEVGGVLGCATLWAFMFKDTHCSIVVAPVPLQCQRPNKPEASFQLVRGSSLLRVGGV